MRVYLAGPMTGYPDLNFPLFHAEAARLRGIGHDVVNPAELNADADKAMEGVTDPVRVAAHWRACMRNDIRELATCDAIALLPGWHRSKGASLEHHIATALGLPSCMAAEFPIADPRADAPRATEQQGGEHG